MVHALNEIRRVLVREGIMIDLRPLMDEIPLEVVSNVVNDVTAVELPSHPLPSQPEVRRAGMADQLPEDRALDEAANRSIAEAEVQNWFVKEREQFFTFNYYWDSPKEMQEYVEAEWSHSITIDEEAWQSIRSTWAVANADARVRIPLKMLIARWKVIKDG